MVLFLMLTGLFTGIFAVSGNASPLATPAALRVLSLNLHGYHPMDELPRFSRDRQGLVKAADQYLTYFAEAELARGHEKQLGSLAVQIAALRPTLIFLQEVGAGIPAQEKNCETFLASTPGDNFGKNSALRLLDRLQNLGFSYSGALACRGNVGWQTYPDTFADQQIVRGPGLNGPFELVRDFSANPYPNGFLVEGTAILALEPWVLSQEKSWRLPLPGTEETFFFQTAIVTNRQSGQWLLVANLHAGWNLRHFEQSILVRKTLSDILLSRADTPGYAGTITGGDFNASLYRPSRGQTAPASVAWEMRHWGSYDFTGGRDSYGFLEEQLWAQHLDIHGQYTGSLGSDEAAARARVTRAVDAFSEASNAGVLPPQTEVFETAVCAQGEFAPFEPSCYDRDRIDLVFLSAELRALRAAILWSKNSFTSPKGISDHPGVLTDVLLRPAP